MARKTKAPKLQEATPKLGGAFAGQQYFYNENGELVDQAGVVQSPAQIAKLKPFLSEYDPNYGKTANEPKPVKETATRKKPSKPPRTLTGTDQKYYYAQDGLVVDEHGTPVTNRIIAAIETPPVKPPAAAISTKTKSETETKDILEPIVSETEETESKATEAAPQGRSFGRVARGKEPKSKGKKKNTKQKGGVVSPIAKMGRAGSKAFLKNLFPGPYGLYEDYQKDNLKKQEEKVSADNKSSDQKRLQGDIKAGLDQTNALMKDSTSLLRQSISKEERITTLLGEISSTLSVIKWLLLLKAGSGALPGGLKMGNILKYGSIAGLAGLGVGSAALMAESVDEYKNIPDRKDKDKLDASSTNPDGTPKTDAEMREEAFKQRGRSMGGKPQPQAYAVGTPPTQNNSLAELSQTKNISVAKENTLEKTKYVSIEVDELLFKSNKINFDTQKFTLDAKSVEKIAKEKSVGDRSSQGASPAVPGGGSSPPSSGSPTTSGSGGSGGSSGAASGPAGGSAGGPEGTTPKPEGTAAASTTPGGTGAQASAQTTAGSTAPPASGTYTKAQMFKLMKDAGATDEEAKVFQELGFRESSGNPNAHNDRGNDDSYGLWQINLKSDRSRLQRLGLTDPEQLKDPATNARAALMLYRGQLGGRGGWRHWSTYRGDEGGAAPQTSTPTQSGVDEITRQRSNWRGFAEGTPKIDPLDAARGIAGFAAKRSPVVGNVLNAASAVRNLANGNVKGALGDLLSAVTPFGVGGLVSDQILPDSINNTAPQKTVANKKKKFAEGTSPYGFAQSGSYEDTSANFFAADKRMMAAQKMQQLQAAQQPAVMAASRQKDIPLPPRRPALETTPSRTAPGPMPSRDTTPASLKIPDWKKRDNGENPAPQQLQSVELRLPRSRMMAWNVTKAPDSGHMPYGHYYNQYDAGSKVATHSGFA